MLFRSTRSPPCPTPRTSPPRRDGPRQGRAGEIRGSVQTSKMGPYLTNKNRFGEEEVKFHFSKFRDNPYRKDLEDEQGKTIAGLAAIFYGTPIEDQEEDLEGENANEDIEDE